MLVSSEVLEKFSALHQEMLDHWTERECRKKIEGANQQHRPDEENEKGAPVDGKCPSAKRRQLFSHERTCKRKDRNDHQEPSDQHRDAKRRVVPQSVAV